MTGLTLERTAPNVATVTRRFAASPAAVFEAHMNPEILKQWLFGPDGWSLVTCVNDARPGGKMHYVWREDATGHSFSLTGEFVLIDPPQRIIHIERMHLPDPTPDNRVETRFTADGAGTLMVMTMTVPDAATLEAMLATGMADGMEMSYKRLETLGKAA